MKQFFTIGSLALIMTCNAQNKATIAAMANAKLLEATVFGTKDSVTLDKLFAKTLSYVHSGGKVETREEALKGITHNKSLYTQSSEPFPWNVSERGDSMVVVHVFKANEKKVDGAESLLNLSIETVWIKEKKNWKLARRKATKVL